MTRRALRAAAVGWHQPTKFTVGSVFSESFRGGSYEALVERRSQILERAPAAGGHIVRARLTRSEGITRADRGPDNPHESRRTTLPILLTVDEAADLLRTTRRGIYTMIERRQLPGVIRIRRRVLLRAEDLPNWLDQKRAPSPEE